VPPMHVLVEVRLGGGGADTEKAAARSGSLSLFVRLLASGWALHNHYAKAAVREGLRGGMVAAAEHGPSRPRASTWHVDVGVVERLGVRGCQLLDGLVDG
jgi:hypothetical protein